ncbi:hypothetical protein [Vagococcus xieshaowenii]|uniref:Uncharacterized protein n=1 Tax=Vagococcus xieshaowenii TaxID=2562451 RepID=A0A4Z0D278_9ENTE|nr:hypothetical protein [Vagococcus xieshaowenii]QCA27893.1 hypothetical protein E4Z98_00430 [Vagococcus xieshaowenii]TFZ39428.1 hypothetical protein E4031_08960 [Vagococcus xieshaowenii]
MNVSYQLLLTDQTTELIPDTTTFIEKVTLFHQKMPIGSAQAVYLYTKERQLMGVGLASELSQWTLDKEQEDAVIEVRLVWDIEPIMVVSYLNTQAQSAKLKKFKPTSERVNVPANQEATMSTLVDTFLTLLARMGYPLFTVKKAKPAKAQHRFRKDMATTAFYVDSFDSQATVYWQKRQEMLIKSGAVLRQEIPLNKDGSVGLSAKMGQQFRKEHEDKIRDGKTTEDIVLKSVNEVGLFLYYGGTNGWLELKDAAGKTIHEWTMVK